MSELIKKALRNCIDNGPSCKRCPYFKVGNCTVSMICDTLAYIDTLEERIGEMTTLASDLLKKLRMAQDYADELAKQLDGGMSREDKIIDGLERCQDGTPGSCEGCGYSRFNDCGTALMADSLELIKELLEK